MVGGVWKAYSAFKTFTVKVPVPTPQSPTGTITDTTPTYKWTKVTGATQYRYQLVTGYDCHIHKDCCIQRLRGLNLFKHSCNCLEHFRIQMESAGGCGYCMEFLQCIQDLHRRLGDHEAQSRLLAGTRRFRRILCDHQSGQC